MIGSSERGAALVTVLLFMTLTFILITSMLAVTGNEVVMSGLQRDGIRAVEYAQAGLNEAIKRMEEGRRYYYNDGSSNCTSYTRCWTTSLNGGTYVIVTRRVVGVNSGYMEIAATSTVGRSTRKLSMLVLQRTLTFPPNITFADKVTEQGSADISKGDAYARTFMKYKSWPSDDTYTYTGYSVQKCNSDGSCTGAGSVGPCYPKAVDGVPVPGGATSGNVNCSTLDSKASKWYPGTRLSENESSDIGKVIKDQTLKCPDGGGGSLPTEQISGTICDPTCRSVNWDRYGFDRDTSGSTDYAVNATLPCGLPYRWDNIQFQDPVTGTQITRLFKRVVFEQWFINYWQFNEATLQYEKKSALISHPEFGAVPPFPDFSAVEGNYDRRVTCTGTCAVNSGDFGECISTTTSPPCQAPTDRPLIVWLDGDASTTWDINANLTGHGTMVVDGNLRINGTFEYWGTVIVNGTAENTFGGGNPRIHGGLVAQNTLSLSGNIEVDGDSSVTNVPVGRSIITGKAWWER